MKKAKIEKLRKAGCRVTNAKDFLGLSEAEAALVELKIALTEYLREVRAARRISQFELAKRMGSSQSRVAKIEASTNDVSLDLIFKALLALGEDTKKLGRAIADAA